MIINLFIKNKFTIIKKNLWINSFLINSKYYFVKVLNIDSNIFYHLYQKNKTIIKRKILIIISTHLDVDSNDIKLFEPK